MINTHPSKIGLQVQSKTRGGRGTDGPQHNSRKNALHAKGAWPSLSHWHFQLTVLKFKSDVQTPTLDNGELLQAGEDGFRWPNGSFVCVPRTMDMLCTLTKHLHQVIFGCFLHFILTEFVQTHNDKGLEDIKLQSILDPSLEPLQNINPPKHQSWQDLFSLYEDSKEYVPTSHDFNKYIHKVSRGGIELARVMGSNKFHWLKYPQRKRDLSESLAIQCCQSGCTRNEIGKLC